ncbi:MAG: peptidoglycan recognition family protein [Myxococcota bacterium]
MPPFRFEQVPGVERLKPREPADVTGVIVHRIEVSQEDPSYGDAPSEVARFFREHPIGVKATGGDMPYPILVDRDGGVTQTVPLRFITPHAKAHNPGTVGVGVIGDFRKAPPSPRQRAAAVAVCAALLTRFALKVETISGHDELQGGSNDPDKICPGPGLAPADVRDEVRAFLATHTAELAFVW